MIQINRDGVKIVESKGEALTRLTGKKSAQHVFNDLLWDIIARAGGSVTISCEDLRNVPPNVKLVAEFNGTSLTVRSVKTGGNILSPPNAGRIIPV